MRLSHGQTAQLTRVFTEEDVIRSMELTQDYSPVYTEQHNEWTDVYPEPILPALLAESLITQVISTKLPGVPCILVQKDLVYYSPVHIHDPITVELIVIDINEERKWITQKVTCWNSKKKEVIKGQVVVFLLPEKVEQ
ncbi:hypothetical protein ACE1TF_06585 [Geomicrobium sp. JSM 1781026]|uniref:hypothetical protein n=1 Tax=Geomicrobium sp. JSM 1781026 TaxID=3344580 RepID=UPI0035BF4812